MSMLDRFLYERENLELKQQMNIYEQQIRNDIENNRKIRTIKHDMKHHIREINDLLMKDKVQQAKDYLQQMSDEIISAQNIYNTCNEAFDGILNFYAEKYMNKGLELVVSVVIPENLKINIYDVNIILGNLLDNALENAIDNSKVSLNIKYTAGMIHISMSNLYDGGIKKEDGHIISKKGDKDNHGYGLNNIKRIVDKYDGSMIEEYENGQFEIAIIIYLE
jgi:two-component system sensor histidine kinase AgrC